MLTLIKGPIRVITASDPRDWTTGGAGLGSGFTTIVENVEGQKTYPARIATFEIVWGLGVGGDATSKSNVRLAGSATSGHIDDTGGVKWINICNMSETPGQSWQTIQEGAAPAAQDTTVFAFLLSIHFNMPLPPWIKLYGQREGLQYDAGGSITIDYRLWA